MSEFDLRAISLGAGVQSSAMYLMACEGELQPRPSVAIFADTQSEPPWVYSHLDWLEKNFGHVIPIHRVTTGSLEKNLYLGGEGRKGFAQIPAFLDGEGVKGIGRRGCTYSFKILPLQKAARELLGLKKGERAAGKFRVQQWIGISTDEAHRAKDSDVSWITRHYPLLFDVPMRRGDCIRWVEQHGYPIPSKSSCYFCPYHSDQEWKNLRDNEPALFARAVQLDKDLRTGEMRCSKGLLKKQYLHSGCKPLGETEFKGENQPDFFGNECEGVCGI